MRIFFITIFLNENKMHVGLGDYSPLRTYSDKKNYIPEFNPNNFIISDNEYEKTSPTPKDSSTTGGRNQPLAGNMSIIFNNYGIVRNTFYLCQGSMTEDDQKFLFDLLKDRDRSLYEKSLDRDGIPQINKVVNNPKLRELLNKTR
jgi:hypothetical protein